MNDDFTDYYDSNLALLKKNHLKIWHQITESPSKPMGKISFAPNGSPNLTVINNNGTKVVLHHEVFPESESDELLKNISEKHTGFVAILGMGLGYTALNILKERPLLQSLALFELEPGIFIQALRYMNLEPILKDPRLILCIGGETELVEALDKAYRTLQLEDANIFHHRPSFELNPKGYEQLQEDLFAHINGLNTGGATTRILGKNFFNNRFMNISTLHHQLLLEQLQNKFADIPAILVAGGPSLDKNIHLLKQAQEKAVIIAADTVLPILLAHGVHPHFLTCIDANNLTYEKFADVIPKVRDTALICSSWVNPKTPKNFPANQTFWTFTGKPIEVWLNSLLGGNFLTGGASTVAHLNLISAGILGCDPIIFMGQDLSFPNSASHAKGTVLQGLAPTGDIIGKLEENTVKGIDGRLLRTNRSFLGMKKHFEAMIADSDKTFINATQGGAHIQGTQILTLQETIDKYCRTQIFATERLKQFYNQLTPINVKNLLSGFNKILEKIKIVQKNIEKADQISESVLSEINNLKMAGIQINSFEMFSKSQQQQINQIDQLHKNLDDTLEIWKIVEEITMEGVKATERKKQAITLFENDPSQYCEWLIQNLNRLLEINVIRKQTTRLLAHNLRMVISFHQKEKKYLKEKKDLRLARLYMESKNHSLAKPLLEKLCRTMPESGEVYFYLGCLATESNLQEKADHCFQTAIKHDPKLKIEIDAYLKKLGDDFLTFARYFKTQPGREISEKCMVQKGLRYDPNHSELKKELEIVLKRDLEKIKADVDADNYQESALLIAEWYQYTMDRQNLPAWLSPELVGKILLYQGKLFLSQKDYENSLACLQNAMGYIPDNPNTHSAAIDVLFVTGDFNGAIEALANAIKVDNKFAGYWETIGDSLQSAGQNEDALLAYEKCFVYLPDNLNLLKKIGDCYLALDQLEAAKAAYQQLKSRMEELK